MTLLQVLFFSVLQGASELFPVSSLGHAVVFPALLHWRNAGQILNTDGPFLPFIVTLHLGTALALLVYYRKDWANLAKAFFQQFGGKSNASRDAHIANLLIVGTIPAGLLGLVLEKKLRLLFASPTKAAVFLIVNGFLMIIGEALRRYRDQQHTYKMRGLRSKDPNEVYVPDYGVSLSKLSIFNALIIGSAQALALIPGISRSGVTMTAGLLLVRLSHEEAARFSFLLATPIILAAGIFEVPKLRHEHGVAMPHIAMYSAIGFVVAGITAYFSVKFLSHYFEKSRLEPFGYYCIALGLLTLFATH